MGSVGDAYDNSMAESFFGTFECEPLVKHRYKNRNEARLSVFDFIEWYNHRRRHTSIGLVAPPVCERRFAETTAVA
jgi:putative transposase